MLQDLGTWGDKYSWCAIPFPASISTFYLTASPFIHACYFRPHLHAPLPRPPIFFSVHLCRFLPVCPRIAHSISPAKPESERCTGSMYMWIMEEAGFALTRCVWWLTSALRVRVRVRVCECVWSRCTPIPLLNYSASNLFPSLPQKPFRWQHLGLKSVNRRLPTHEHRHKHVRATKRSANTCKDQVWLTWHGMAQQLCCLFASFMLSHQGRLAFFFL